MPYGVNSAFQWLASAFYVIVSLAIVYLYFFRLVPLVISKVGAWTLGAVIQVTVVLAAVAILLGGAAVYTADWIFSQVLTSLPNTRMAYEVNRITGSVLQLPAGPPPSGAPPPGSYSSPYDSPYVVPQSSGVVPTPESATALGSGNLSSDDDASLQLKPNALELWAGMVQEIYNPTGDTSDNTNVMSKRDIPQGVMCDVFAVGGGFLPKRYEEWNLACSDNGFRNSVVLTVNGTAARGLTGGSYYAAENPLPVFGTGLWPEIAYEPASAPSPTPGGTPGDPTPTPDATAQPATAGGGGGNVHTVEAGESLASIANQYGTTVDLIIQQNVEKYPQLQNNPNVIRTGWALDIP